MVNLKQADPVEMPCSQSQKRFWFETIRDPHNAGINVAVRWRLEGEVVHAHIEEAWRLIIARHETLRAAFVTVDGEPHQLIEPEVAFHVPLIDLTEISSEAAAAEAERLASLEARKLFDITRAPLIRVTLVRMQPQVAMILVTLHHAVCDGWSVGILAAEMGEICAALGEGRSPVLPDLVRSYADYAEKEREWLDAAAASYRSDLAHLLRGFEQFEVLPDKARPPVQTSNGEIASFLLDREVTNGLAELARKKRCTMFMVAYGTLLAILHRYTGATDITIGTPFSGREEVEFESLVGTFVNTIPLRTEVDGDITFDELLERTRDTVTDAYELRYVPFEEVIAVVNPKRDLSRNTLCSINFSFQRSFIKNETYGSFRLIDLPSRSAGPICDLTFFMVERPEGWRASCEFNTDLYRRGTVEQLLQRWIGIMRAIGNDSSCPLGALPLMTEDERQAILALGVGPTTTYERDAGVHDVFAARAAEFPDAVAVLDGTTELTYRELDRRSNQLAHYLRSAGIGSESRVGVALERSTLVPIAFLAVLKAGACYVPLDPSYPPERLSFMTQDANVSLIVTESSLRERLPQDVRIVDLAEASQQVAAQSDAALEQSGNGDAPAYVMYTSGSTGRPKGVVVAHRGIVRLVRATNYLEIGRGDTVLQYGALTFDSSTFEIWAALLNGGRLAIPAPGPLSAAELRRALERFAVTAILATPAVFRETVESDLNAFSGLRTLLVGGDVLSPSHAKRLIEAFPKCRLINAYGPTENTTISCVYAIPPTDDVDDDVPIGRSITNSSAFVLDSKRSVVPPGVVGELCVGGDGLAIGYVNLPELTTERFVMSAFLPEHTRLYRTGDRARMREDGVIEFLGRFDQQVKIRGFRIEPGEVEAVLSRHPGVSDSAVVVGTDSSGDKTIWAYVVPRDSGLERFDVEAVRAWLKERLPMFMLPSAIVALNSLPLTSHGKVDRSALPVPEKKSAVTPYQGVTEERLGSILADLLGTVRVDRDADIFSLGFHSLLAMRFTARVNETFEFGLPLRVLFENPTIAALAAYIDDSVRAADSPAAPPIVTLNPGGTRPPFIYFHSDLFADGLHSRQLAAALGADQPVYAVAPHGAAGLPLLPTIESMARDYASLIRSVQPAGPYRLGGYCASGLVAYELARLLRAQGEVVERLVLLNASPMPTRSIGVFDALVRRIGLNERLAPRVRDRLCYNLARLHGAILMGPRTALAFVAKTLGAPLSGGAQKPARVLEPQSFEKRQGQRETETSFAHLVAAFTYHPKPHDGDATLIWSEEQETTFDDRSKGWGAVLTHVTVESVGGGHVGTIRDHIHELAQLLKSVLGD